MKKVKLQHPLQPWRALTEKTEKSSRRIGFNMKSLDFLNIEEIFKQEKTNRGQACAEREVNANPTD